MQNYAGDEAASCVIRVTGPTMRLRGQVTPPGNKNTAMPALVAAALSSAGAAEIHNVPNIADIRELFAILTSIGLDVTLTKNVLTTRPRQPTGSVIPNQLSSKLRGSVYALAILARFFSRSEIGDIGGDALPGRTLESHIHALAGYGVEMRRNARGWKLFGGPGHPGEFTLGDRPAGITATCLALLLGAALEGRSVIREASDELEVRDIIECVNTLGATAFRDGTTLVVKGPMNGANASWVVPGDHIYSATMAIGIALTGGETILPIGMANRMPAILRTLEDTGIQVRQDDATLRLHGRATRSVSFKTGPFPGFPGDAGPLMAALLTQANGASYLTDTINPQRFDHFQGLRKLGVDIRVDGDQATIVGPCRLLAAKIRGFGIRETAALVLASLMAEGTTLIEDGQALFRGYEDLPRDLAAMGAVADTVWSQ